MATILSQSAFIQINISTWTGRAKLQLADLNVSASDLPPEDLASLGTKKLTDPKALRPFSKVKTRVTRLMGQYAIKFMGGWLIDPQYIPAVEAELLRLQQEFQDATHTFVSSYEDELDQWCAQHPDWDSIIRSAAPQVLEVERRFRFRWQTFQIQPTADTAGGEALEQDASAVCDEVVRQLAQDIATVLHETFEGRSDSAPITAKTWGSLTALTEKCDRVGLFNPEATYVAGILNTLVSSVSKDADPSVVIPIVVSTLRRMSDPAQLQDMINEWREQPSFSPSVTAALATPRVTAEPEPAPEQLPAPEPVISLDAAQLGLAVPAAAPAMPEPVQGEQTATSAAMDSLRNMLGF